MNTCKECKYGINYGDSVEYIYCERGKRKKSVRKVDTCKKIERVESYEKEN